MKLFRRKKRITVTDKDLAALHYAPEEFRGADKGEGGMKEFIWKIFGMPQKYYIWAPEADIWIRVSKSFFYKLRVGDIISITYIYERVANGWDLARWIKNRSEIIRKMSGLSDFEIKVLDIYYESPIILFAYWGDHRIVAELKRTDRV